MNEIWKDIEGYDGLYKISNMGNVKSLKYGKERILKPAKVDGYLRVCLCKNSKYKWFKIHRLVAEAFLDNPYNLPEVNHKDEDKSNNNVDNLEWCSRQYNINYGTGHQRSTETQTNGSKSKTVYQYTLDGVLVAEYPSIMEAQRQLGFNQGYICNCCNGRFNKAYGYIWKYKRG